MGERGCSRVEREYRKCWSQGYCRVDRENREMSREGLDRLIEQVRQVAYRLHGHIRLNLVWFMRRLNLLPILPISTAKHTNSTILQLCTVKTRKSG